MLLLELQVNIKVFFVKLIRILDYETKQLVVCLLLIFSHVINKQNRLLFRYLSTVIIHTTVIIILNKNFLHMQCIIQGIINPTNSFHYCYLSNSSLALAEDCIV